MSPATLRAISTPTLDDSYTNKSVVVALPAGIQPGDLLVMFVVATATNLRGPDRGGEHFDVPGWTCLADKEEDAESSRISVFAKIAAVGETNPTVTFRTFLNPADGTASLSVIYAWRAGTFNPNINQIVHAQGGPSQYDYLYSQFPWDGPTLTTTIDNLTIMNFCGGDGTERRPVERWVIHVPATSSDGYTVENITETQIPAHENGHLVVSTYTQAVAGPTHLHNYTIDDPNSNSTEPLMWAFAIAPPVQPKLTVMEEEIYGIYRNPPEGGVFRRHKAPNWYSRELPSGSKQIAFNLGITATPMLNRKLDVKLDLASMGHPGLAPSLMLAPSTSLPPSATVAGFSFIPAMQSSKDAKVQTLNAGISFTPALRMMHKRLLQLSSSFALTLGRRKTAVRVLGTAINFATGWQRKISLARNATIAFIRNMQTGNLTLIDMPVTLATTTAVAISRVFRRGLNVNTAFSLIVKRLIGQSLIASASLTPTQKIVRRQTYAASVALSPTVLTRRVAYRTLSQPFTLMPEMDRYVFASFVFARTLNFTVVQSHVGGKQIGLALDGSLTLSPNMQRRIGQQIQASTVLLALAANLPARSFATTVHLAATLNKKQLRREQFALLLHMAATAGVNPTLITKPFGTNKIVSAVLVSKYG